MPSDLRAGHWCNSSSGIAPRARALDIGCGQGRDALFIARLGHEVTGVDLSPHGIRAMQEAAASEVLEVTGVVADLAEFQPDGYFDVIVIDRTLHMLDAALREAVLARLLRHVAQCGWVLISDERSNMAGLRAVIDADGLDWRHDIATGGQLFLQRD